MLAKRLATGALQNKSISMWGSGQPIQESLHSEILEQFLEWSVLCAGLVEEALPHRCTELASAHRIASRYGRMIFWTWLISANFVSFARFGLGVRSRYVRSASIGMSSPILFRYLKQSAIVFSAE